MWRGIKRGAQKLMGGGALYLAKEVYNYEGLRNRLDDFKISGVDQVEELPPVSAVQKEWMIVGRQSPGYVRDPEKYPKTHLMQKIEQAELFFTQLGTHMDNEKHYDLFEGSDFVVELFTDDPKTPKIMVQPDQMFSTEIDKIEDDARYEAGFARKQGFADITQKSPLYHSSLAFRVLPDDKKPSTGTVVLTGKEIKEVIANTNATICEKQHCNLYSSNCYSASVFAMGEIVKILDARPPTNGDQTKDIAKVADVISDVALDNGARGVSNNSVVRHQITMNVGMILEKRHLIEPPTQSTGSTLKV